VPTSLNPLMQPLGERSAPLPQQLATGAAPPRMAHAPAPTHTFAALATTPPTQPGVGLGMRDSLQTAAPTSMVALRKDSEQTVVEDFR
jgi:hypothetical protein